ncbi:MAG TPA: hypothetical protein VLE24_03020 [Methyloceanibacter sp.]|nr:hypothetical protein [Methyloceanibacter sp.]
MKIGTLVLAAGLALPALPATAESITLAGDELRQAISGKTVYLNVSGFELPIVYSANGRMKGTMGTVAASFSTGNGAADRGKWWVENDQLCQKWNSWMDGQSYCYKLTLNGNKVTWVRNDGPSGTARISG